MLLDSDDADLIYTKMNDILKSKKQTLSSAQNPVQPVRFKSFVAAEKSKLRTAYPFLSADQINRKIKEKWKLQNQCEQLQCTKTALKDLHLKRGPSSSIKNSPKRQRKIEVCETPEYVNLYKLHGFRKQHTESYKNDFQPDENSGSITEEWTSTKIKECKGGDLAQRASATCEIPDKGPAAFRLGQDVSNDIVMEQKDTSDSASLHSDEEDDGILIRRTDFDNNGDVDGEMSVDKEEFDMSKNGNEGNGKYDDVCFKSPNPKRSLVEQTTKKGSRQQAPADLTTPKFLSTLQGNSTPQVSSVAEEAYTTPQMDEVLQKMTINEAKKAPQKQKYSYESANQLEKMKAVASGRRVTRSLVVHTAELNADGKEFEGTNERVVSLNKTGMIKGKFDSKKEHRLSLKNMKKIKDLTDEEGQCNNDIKHFKEAEKFDGRNLENTILKSESKNTRAKTNKRKCLETENLEVDENAIEMTPSGDASQTGKDHVVKKVDSFIFKMEANDYSEGNTKIVKNKLPVSKSGKNVKKQKRRHITSSEFGEYNKDEAKDDFSLRSSVSSGSESLCSVRYGSSPASFVKSPTSLRESSRNTEPTNPALEKVLHSLQSTRVTSPSWSFSNSSVSSPRLLSPALSGVSELSSLSDQHTNQDEMSGDVDTFTNINMVQEEKDLCEMFNDVTPPESKTKGLYKTTRMLSSGGQEENSQFKQIFNEESDDIFF
ncbi:uncharacterized protein LOC123557432 isoform X2 [Mercenaria mercenaria]|uniref:uncharacterized protein LOC123557432 isoform X2 n=1 Tax=Mercenaria mercenaria TaxID=6596 RepID=UPI00234F0778|nr:uncharacterized protein LOC123557432 isoform X2 [Mercenaria mercenaria]